ncbi:MAG: hypothetical protein LLF94_08875 [Chlamydiales bacterium]|nr:hypothetical protein [Chlamydiales bacterium]
MPSLNPQKKAKTAKTLISIKTLPAKKKATTITPKKIVPKPRKKACASCSSNQTTPVKSGQRRSHIAKAPDKETTLTTIIVHFDCGMPNSLYIRGEGIKGLSWEKGMLMQCTKADEWIWQTDVPFNKAEIKILLNDKEYELGENHAVDCGKEQQITPRFQA